VSARITNATRQSDIAARLGGDEFAIALIGTELSDAEAFGRHIIEALSQPYQIGATALSIAASIGIAG